MADFEERVEELFVEWLQGLRQHGLHIHVHHHVEGAPDTNVMLTALREMKVEIMTKLDTAAAAETADANKLIVVVGLLGDALTALRSENNPDLKQALADAGANADATANILNVNDLAINTALANANALLNPSTGGGTDTTTGGAAPDVIPSGGAPGAEGQALQDAQAASAQGGTAVGGMMSSDDVKGAGVAETPVPVAPTADPQPVTEAPVADATTATPGAFS